ncbi:acid phosphatase 1 isoform X1 [Typha angustifolia]|uniref:acid phosphatase 1 isoform X1 n=2 Tax=Typha angustifolia TaxID=59011 RepID=UPI003C300AB4
MKEWRYMFTLMVALWELILLMLSNLFSRTTEAKPSQLLRPSIAFDTSYCLSWRLAVEANNAKGWRTVPPQCVFYVESYMFGGQYSRDLDTAMEQVGLYLNGVSVGGDGMDAWVLDVDDTCLSNLFYYQGKQFGGVPFDPVAFKSWASEGICPAIPAVLGMYKRLIQLGYKVFLLTGRDEVSLGSVTTSNLKFQGFDGYERLIMRTAPYKGLSATLFKSAIRKQLVAEGYRLRGNIGDQWSDLQGDYVGDRIFKLPNPMYFVP